MIQDFVGSLPDLTHWLLMCPLNFTETKLYASIFDWKTPVNWYLSLAISPISLKNKPFLPVFHSGLVQQHLQLIVERHSWKLLVLPCETPHHWSVPGVFGKSLKLETFMSVYKLRGLQYAKVCVFCMSFIGFFVVHHFVGCKCLAASEERTRIDICSHVVFSLLMVHRTNQNTRSAQKQFYGDLANDQKNHLAFPQLKSPKKRWTMVDHATPDLPQRISFPQLWQLAVESGAIDGLFTGQQPLMPNLLRAQKYSGRLIDFM